MLEQGTQAPEIELSDHNGDTVRLSGLRGKWVALFWYPKASTPG